MRTPDYLSYTGLSLWETQPEEYYLKYLAETRPARIPQTPAMSIGSGFDARVKSALHADLFGPSPEFEFETIFEQQVDPQNRDWCLPESEYIFECYKRTGAYDELLELLQQSTEEPRFEFTLTGKIAGAPFTGKPDLRFTLPGVGIIFDWKVKGYCSKHGASPTKGYALCRDAYDGKPSRSHGKAHKLYLEMDHHGFKINAGYMEDYSKPYADQGSLYGWMLDAEPGDENTVVLIDETVARPADPRPLLRVANHRSRVRREYQLQLWDRVYRCWEAISSGHVFPDLPREESDAKCEQLDGMAVALTSDGSESENWFNEVVRPQFYR